MKQVLIPLRRVLALFLAGWFFFATLPIKSDPIAPLDRDNLRLCLAVLSDMHTEANNIPRFKINRQTLKHLDTVKDTADALVLLGDNTMNGQTLESLFCYGMLEAVNPIKPYYPIVGNHDVGNRNEPDGSFADMQARQLTYLQTFVDASLDTLYYSKTVNGSALIFLAPDTDESSSRNLSDAQLNWLEAQLDEAAKTQAPIFVFNHYPLSHIGQGRDRYQALVTKYPNTFVAVGHMHYYIHFGTIRGENNTPEIWVPCLSMMEDDGAPNEKTGLGYLLEVYDNEVVWRGVNYYEGSLTDVEQRYALETAPAESE